MLREARNNIGLAPASASSVIRSIISHYDFRGDSALMDNHGIASFHVLRPCPTLAYAAR